MPSQLDNPPLESPLIGAQGLISPQWRPFFSRLTQAVQAVTERWTTANRPTSGLWAGRMGFNTSTGAVDVWTGSAWITLSVSAGNYLPLAAGSGSPLTDDLYLGGNDLVNFGNVGGASAAEIGYLSGVTSAIQTQLAAKLALAGGNMAGILTLSSSGGLRIGSLTGFGNLRLVDSASASSDATVDFTLTSDHDAYLLVGTNVVPVTDGAIGYLRISIAGSYKSGATDYRYAAWAFNDSGGSGLAVSTGTTRIQITGTVGSATAEGFSFLALVYGPGNTALHKHILFMGGHHNTSGNEDFRVGAGRYATDAGAIDGLRFLFSSGNIESGEFALYGLGT